MFATAGSLAGSAVVRRSPQRNADRLRCAACQVVACCRLCNGAHCTLLVYDIDNECKSNVLQAFGTDEQHSERQYSRNSGSHRHRGARARRRGSRCAGRWKCAASGPQKQRSPHPGEHPAPSVCVRPQLRKCTVSLQTLGLSTDGGVAQCCSLSSWLR